MKSMKFSYFQRGYFVIVWITSDLSEEIEFVSIAMISGKMRIRLFRTSDNFSCFDKSDLGEMFCRPRSND